MSEPTNTPSEKKDSSMKGCSDGQNCQYRNICVRYKKRHTFAECMKFYILYQPACTLLVREKK